MTRDTTEQDFGVTDSNQQFSCHEFSSLVKCLDNIAVVLQSAKLE